MKWPTIRYLFPCFLAVAPAICNAEPPESTQTISSISTTTSQITETLAQSTNLGQLVTVSDTTYIGNFRFEQPSGLPTGQGRVEWRNGDSYEGALEHGLRNGHGIFIAKTNGFRYEGKWQDNLQSGKGKTTFDDGDIYEGEMENGLFHGRGTYRSRNGSRYDGEWQNGLKEGQGKLTFSDGDNWEGIFSNDQRTNQGKMNFVEKMAPQTEDEEESLP